MCELCMRVEKEKELSDLLINSLFGKKRQRCLCTGGAQQLRGGGCHALCTHRAANKLLRSQVKDCSLGLRPCLFDMYTIHLPVQPSWMLSHCKTMQDPGSQSGRQAGRQAGKQAGRQAALPLIWLPAQKQLVFEQKFCLLTTL